jgi:CBS domain-containing protein
MRLQDIMTSPVETITPDASVSEARQRLKTLGANHLVVKRGNAIAGVLSSRDLARAAPDDPVSQVMSDHLVSATPKTTVREAANLLRGRTIGCLPVVDRGRVVGIITVSDLLELIGKGVEKPIAKSARWTLRSRGPRKTRPSLDRTRSSFT